MVRKYIQEEEVRSKHQAALLALREKAIVEKTKAEMAYLEMQKKSLGSCELVESTVVVSNIVYFFKILV